MYATDHMLLEWDAIQEIREKYCNVDAGFNLGLLPANERLRYFVTTSLIGSAQA